jgi:CBS domain-containing protein
MKVREIMTAEPACCTPSDSVRHAAGLMAQHDCGSIPVVSDMESHRLVGVVTDRDVAVRAVACGLGPETQVSDVMSSSPHCCGPDDELAAVERLMAERQVRRVPIVDEAGCCVGMVAQADLARDQQHASDHEVRQVVERISSRGSQTSAESREQSMR